MYTIGQVSERTGLPISTLRYYDKEGLIPHMERVSGARRFSERELEALRVIECLKASDTGTYCAACHVRVFLFHIKTGILKGLLCCRNGILAKKRRELLERQKETLEAQMDDLRRSLAMLQFKCWYYEQAMQDGGEERIQAMLPDKLPAEVQVLYDLAHGRTPGKTALNVSAG